MLHYLHQPPGVLHISLPHAEGARANVVENHIIQPSELFQSKIYHFVRVWLVAHVCCYVESSLGSQTQALLRHLWSKDQNECINRPMQLQNRELEIARLSFETIYTFFKFTDLL